MRAMAAALFAALLLCTALPAGLANSCPSFASSTSACTKDTCGRYIYRGRFLEQAVKQFSLSATEGGIKLGPHSQPGDCCRQCMAHRRCAFWNFFSETGACHLFNDQLCNATGTSVFIPAEPNTFVGGRCNKGEQGESHAAELASTAQHEPLQPRTFCLLTDPAVHINMMLDGYLDSRTPPPPAPGGANLAGSDLPSLRGRASRPDPRSLFSLGTWTGTNFNDATSARGSKRGARTKPVRVWIRELSFMWGMAGPGQKQHLLRLQARRGPSSERGEGFLGKIEVDGTEIAQLQLGEELNLFDGQASLVYDSQARDGPVDVDTYFLRVNNVIEAKLRLRPAHPLLRQPGDAMVHMGLDIVDMSYSNDVHGFIGQFFQEQRPTQMLDYSLLSSLMAEPFLGHAVLGSQRPPKLDGEVEDYATSDIGSPDCRYSQFTLAPIDKVQHWQKGAKRLAVEKKAST